MAKIIWLRVELPPGDVLKLENDFSGAIFVKGDEGSLVHHRLRAVDAIFTEEALPDSLVKEMPNLRWLHGTRGGVSAYLTPSIKSRPIEVTGSKGIHGTVFSEFALGCILMFAKKLPQCIEAQREKKWQRLVPFEIEGKTLGIVGLGTAGDALARKAKTLGMRVIATRRTATAKPDYVDQLGTPEFLPTLLAESDFVVLLLAAVPSTVNIIGEEQLRLLKPTAYLINLTGGRAVEERLLVRALQEKWFAGAALDAFEIQPLPADSPLWSLPNVIIAPRIAGITNQKWPTILPIFRENLRRFLAGEPLTNLVDKELGY
jgi:phosphoglycerate dehydrogenase-like enzyme